MMPYSHTQFRNFDQFGRNFIVSSKSHLIIPMSYTIFWGKDTTFLTIPYFSFGRYLNILF